MYSPEQFVGRMSAAQAVDLFLAPQYRYINPGAERGPGIPPVFTRVSRVNKNAPYQAVLIKHDGWDAYPINGACDTSGYNQGDQATQRKIEFYGEPYDYSGDMCAADFYHYCANWEKSVQELAFNPAQNISDLLKAVIAAKFKGARMDFARIAWFAKPNIAEGTTAPFYITAFPGKGKRMLGKAQKAKGAWASIEENVTNTLTPYVDSNDGTLGSVNILNPANVAAFLQRMIDAASPELAGISANDPNAPFFLVDKAIFEAYRKSLVSVYNAEAWKLGQAGPAVANVLEYNGYMVYCDKDADNFDAAVGARTTTTIASVPTIHSRNLRALFTVPNNIGLGLDMDSVTEFGGNEIGLKIQPAVSLEKAGMLEYKMIMSLGTGIMHPELMVAAWASDTSTFPAA